MAVTEAQAFMCLLRAGPLRKHLDLQFVCGGCFSKSFLNGPALNKHMKACASVTADRGVDA